MLCKKCKVNEASRGPNCESCYQSAERERLAKLAQAREKPATKSVAPKRPVETRIAKTEPEQDDWGFLEKLENASSCRRRRLEVFGGVAEICTLTPKSGPAQTTLLLAHGRQSPDAWIKVTGKSYHFAYMVPCGCALFREQFTQRDGRTYYNWILDYLKLYASNPGVFLARWCVPEAYVGPHFPFEIRQEYLLTALNEVLATETNVVVFTELHLSDPKSTVCAGQPNKADYTERFKDQKIPLRDLLLMNDWVADDHRFLFMTCRSPWPEGPGTPTGPARIHTWYSEDHVTVDLRITGQ